MELTYHQEGEYLFPDLSAPETPALGKYGLLRRDYLLRHREAIYTGMMLSGTLNSHLEETDRQAAERVESLTEKLAAREGVTEEMKASDPMKWVGLMNNIRQRAEEVVMAELIYNDV